MGRKKQWRRLGRLTLLLSALWFASPSASAQSAISSGQPNLPFSTSSSEWEGYSEFVRLVQRRIGTSRVKPAAQLDFSELQPSDAVIVVHPLTHLDERSFSGFLADGGRVALLDDFGEGNGLLQKFGIQRMNPPDDPLDRLRDNPDLAIAVPSVQLVAGAERGRHPIAENVTAVVTNHPLVFRHPDLTPVLEIKDKAGRAEALAVTGVIAKKGRLFALGDPSVFINLMLRYPGNRNLAEGLVDYLSEREPEAVANEERGLRESASLVARPTGKVWIVANDFEQVGFYGDDESFLDRLRRHFEEAAEALAGMEEEGIPPMMATFLAAMLALWVISTQLKGNVLLPKLTGPSFSRVPLLAAQTGLGARADILSSRNANPILALMEIDAALRETAARRLGVIPGGTQSETKDTFTKAGLSPDDSASLAALLSDLRSYGQSLGQGRPKKTREPDMRRYHRESMRLLDEMERTGRAK